jgi:hypothetical protein
VSRVFGLLPGGEVAAGIAAIGRSGLQVVVSVDVAGRAGNIGVAVDQQETGDAVVECRGSPRDGVVTTRAICRGERSTRLRMRRSVGLLPSGEVAAGVSAVSRSDLQTVVVIDMAGGAGDRGVSVGEGKSG